MNNNAIGHLVPTNSIDIKKIEKKLDGLTGGNEIDPQSPDGFPIYGTPALRWTSGGGRDAREEGGLPSIRTAMRPLKGDRPRRPPNQSRKGSTAAAEEVAELVSGGAREETRPARLRPQTLPPARWSRADAGGRKRETERGEWREEILDSW